MRPELAMSHGILLRTILVAFQPVSKPHADWERVVIWTLVVFIDQNKKGMQRMAKSKLIKANEKIAEKVATTFDKMEDTVVGGYTKIEDAFVDRYLTQEGETVAQAKARLKQEHRF